MDPLRVTLIVAGIVILLTIVIFGRNAKKRKEVLYRGEPSNNKEFSFGAKNFDVLVDEEVRVLPPRQTESEVLGQAKPGFQTHDKQSYGQAVDPALAEKSHKDVHRHNVSNSDSDFSTAYELNSSKTDEVSQSYEMPNQYKTNSNPSVNKPVQQQTPHSEESLKVEAPDAYHESPTMERRTEANSPQKAGPKREETQPKQQQSVRFVVLHIIAASGKPFNGIEISEAAASLGMALGKHNVFHFPASTAATGESSFCLVNMTEQGDFDINNLAAFNTNGMSLIMTLPTKNATGLTIFSNMLAVAQALARKLGGDILDQTKVPLTADIVTTLRSDIAQIESSEKVGSPVPEL